MCVSAATQAPAHACAATQAPARACATARRYAVRSHSVTRACSQEYCNAGSLRMALSCGRFTAPRMPLRWRPVMGVLRSIVSGMQYMHSKDICHGDLNPSNVLLKVRMPCSPSRTSLLTQAASELLYVHASCSTFADFQNAPVRAHAQRRGATAVHTLRCRACRERHKRPHATQASTCHTSVHMPLCRLPRPAVECLTLLSIAHACMQINSSHEDTDPYGTSSHIPVQHVQAALNDNTAQVKLTDFGMSTRMDTKCRCAVSRQNARLGAESRGYSEMRAPSGGASKEPQALLAGARACLGSLLVHFRGSAPCMEMGKHPVQSCERERNTLRPYMHNALHLCMLQAPAMMHASAGTSALYWLGPWTPCSPVSDGSTTLHRLLRHFDTFNT
jgi:serine/threonine protein kinase